MNASLFRLLLAGILVVSFLGYLGAADQGEFDKRLELSDEEENDNADDHVAENTRVEHKIFRVHKSLNDDEMGHYRDYTFFDKYFEWLENNNAEPNPDFIRFDNVKGGWDALIYIDDAVFYNVDTNKIKIVADEKENGGFFGGRKKEKVVDMGDDEMVEQK